ncbi:MAG: HDOD domain-containing protein [Chitinispirillaceae bacterium]|nr:HDOD domain-containing protein [Chitinispirillaceae bacterium]
MISIILISRNVRERQILTMALEQQGFKVLPAEPTYQSFVFLLQFMPDLIAVELPRDSTEQLNFAKRIRGYKRTRLIPIIGYGNSVEPSFIRGMQQNGITAYIERPLKFNDILLQIERLLKPFNKTIGKKPDISDKEKDMALLLEDNVPPSRKIEAMCSHVAKLLAFPFTIATVLKITNDERSGAGHLARAITADPAMTTHLLKVSNSVFFASVNRRIGSIKEAIIRIGFEETKRIVMGMSVMNLFGQSNKNIGFDRTDFWYHSLTTALVAERIARSFENISTEVAFLAGLLHDLGILLFDEFFPPVFSEVLSTTARQAGLLVEKEMDRLKVTHLDLIADLFPKWKIPQEITDAVTGQYRIAETDEPPATAEAKLAACVAIGNLVAKLIHSGRECDEFVMPLSNSLFEAAKLPSGITAGFIESVNGQLTTFRSFLGLEPRDYPCGCPASVDPKTMHIAVWNPDRAVFIPPVIDLQHHGIRCDAVPFDKGASGLDGKYHAVIYWTRSPVDEGMLGSLTGLRQAPIATTSAGNTDNKKMPVILFCPDSESMTRHTECIVVNNRFDLRLLEARLWDLFAGEPVKKENAAAGEAA